MQTFLPYPDFEKSVKCLDYRRLGKQRVECKQILNVLLGKSDGWRNHPAVQMWKGYEDALIKYYNECIFEWEKRGYKNNMPVFVSCKINIEMPWWFGNERFHASHRSNLLRKDYEFYSKYGWKELLDLEYWWPTKEMENVRNIR